MQPLIKKCSSLFNVYLVLVKQMLMLYQNALVLFGFSVIYCKTICCEVNLERERKEEKRAFWLKGRKRKWFDRKIREKGMRVCGENESESAFRIQSKSLTQRDIDRRTEGQTYTYTHAEAGADSRALYKSPGPRLTYPLYHWTV